jgi:Pentapeptide repeats (8 copies)
VGLCCVAPGFARGADFAIDKPAGVACPHLAADDRCGIHPELRERGFGGCAAFDCFGAGQRVVGLLGRRRSARMYEVFAVLRQLHEWLWYLRAVDGMPGAAAVRGPARALAAEVGELAAGAAADLLGADVEGRRDEVRAVLRQASDLVRRPAGPDRAAADLVGADLAGADLRAACLRGALLIGADLRRADLRTADLLGADLRGADLGGADLRGALFLTGPQTAAARGDAATLLPGGVSRPAHWR